MVATLSHIDLLQQNIMQPQGELCASLMLSSAAGHKTEMLKISIHNAIGLAAMDCGGTSDP